MHVFENFKAKAAFDLGHEVNIFSRPVLKNIELRQSSKFELSWVV
jgi:hypothetical protein